MSTPEQNPVRALVLHRLKRDLGRAKTLTQNRRADLHAFAPLTMLGADRKARALLALHQAAEHLQTALDCLSGMS